MTAPDDFRVHIDMEHVARAALGLRSWRLEFEQDARPYNWTGQAANQGAADRLARHDLAVRHPEFSEDEARLVVCVEQ